jgi:probable phosphoglycerate mutase
MIGGHRSCSGLSPLGRKQAEALRDRWMHGAELTPDVVIASQYQRAQETAQITAPALGHAAITIDARFGEHDPGPDCDGLTFAEYSSRYGIGAEAWEAGDPYAVTFPGGETVAAFQFRIGTALQATLGAHEGKTVMIFCHGGVVDAIMRLALKAPPMGAFEIHTLNASITDLLLVRPNVWRLTRYNDTAHLAGLPAGTTSIVDA